MAVDKNLGGLNNSKGIGLLYLGRNAYGMSLEWWPVGINSVDNGGLAAGTTRLCRKFSAKYLISRHWQQRFDSVFTFGQKVSIMHLPASSF